MRTIFRTSRLSIIKPLTTVPILGTIVPRLGTAKTMLSALLTKAKLQVLSLLFRDPDEAFYLRQIIQKLGIGQGAVQRELSMLTGAGIITREKKGNYVFYRANRDNPIFQELHSIIVKTSGIADHLRAALEPFSGKINLAYIYGSIADGTADSMSDIDVMIVGTARLRDLAGPMAAISKELGREVNPTTYRLEEYVSELKKKGSFISSVHDGPRIMLIGDMDEPR